MMEEIYQKLGERLNKNFMRLPLGEPVLSFLKQAFNEEEAAIGAGFPMGSHPLSRLVDIFHREADSLALLLDQMADKGLIFIHKNESGEQEFSLPPFFPGLVEFQSMRGGETPKEVEMAHAIKKMMAYIDEIGRDLFQKPEIANKVLPAALRTLSVEKTLAHDPTILPFEQVSAIIQQETSFAAVYCHCRQQQKLTGTPCSVARVPERTCFYFGKVADFMIERNFGKRVSREECLDILKQCEDAGLVHNINNYLGRSLVLCNCCSCCCDFLVRMKKYRGLQSVAASNFKVRLEKEKCVGCGACISRCQMEALIMEEEKASLIQDYCMGCGNCVSACPSDALSMVRHADVKPIELTFPFPGLGL